MERMPEFFAGNFCRFVQSNCFLEGIKNKRRMGNKNNIWIGTLPPIRELYQYLATYEQQNKNSELLKIPNLHFKIGERLDSF